MHRLFHKLEDKFSRRRSKINSSAPQVGSSEVAATPSTSTPDTNGDAANDRQRKANDHHHQQPPTPASAALPIGMTPAQTPATVPCQYRTGKTLGSGTYAIVKEAVHIKTGKYYACKVINKKLMEGREHMVRNEIHVLKKVSKGCKNVVTLHDYFETAHNLYLVFDLCTGGELFDRICAKGNYYEADAAGLVRTVLKAVRYIHDAGIVHRDLKPENLLFRSPAEDADIMIADFGLSRVMDEEKMNMLTEICGTPGYMAPEIFLRSGHGKPVDIWAIGVITYFLLCGYTPFDRDSQPEEAQAIIHRDFKFEPAEYWAGVSQTARDFVNYCLTSDPKARPTAADCLQHKWLADEKPHFVEDPESPTRGPVDLLPNMKKVFNAKKTFRKAVLSTIAMRRFSGHVGREGRVLTGDMKRFVEEVEKGKEDAENESMDGERHVFYAHTHEHDDDSSDVGSPRTPRTPNYPVLQPGPPGYGDSLTAHMARTSLQ